MSETEAEVIRDLAFRAAAPARLEAGKRYAWISQDGTLTEADLAGDMPSHKTGHVTVTDVASFAGYYIRHADEDSEVFADLDAGTVTAVLDAHHGAQGEQMEWGGARWQQHRLTLSLRLTEPWKTWLEFDRKFMPQEVFADFLEDNYRDLDPDGPVKAADLLEAAQDFRAVIKVEFGSGTRLRSGDVTMTRIETTDAKSGKTGKIDFPEEFDLLLKPYDDCEDTSLSARVRYRTADGLKLGYFLNSPERLRQDAVKQVTAKAAEAIGAAIMQGQPG